MTASDKPLRPLQDHSSNSFRNWLVRDGNGWLLGAALIYVLLFLRFWPQSWTTEDESSYLGIAYALRHGTLYPDAAGIQVVGTFPVGMHMVSKYPLGMPLLLACSSFFGWHAVLGTNLLVHLLSFLVVIRLLRRFDTPAVFAILFLLYPTAVLYSRTVMADPVSGLLLIVAFDRLLNLRPVQCGALLGAAALCRTGNIVALPIFLLAFAAPRFRLRELLLLLAGSLPFLCVAAYYMAAVAQGQMVSHTGNFSASYFPQMFPAYLTGLLIIYPGMLFAPAFFRGEGRQTLLLLCYSMVLLYSFWYFRDQGSTPLETLIVGQRYFLSVLPLFVVAYSTELWRFLRKWPVSVQMAAAGTIAVALLAVAAGISWKHARYTAVEAGVRTRLLEIVGPNDMLICNTQVAKVMNAGWGKREVMVLDGQLNSSERGHIDQKIADAQHTPNARIFVSIWVRPGRADDAQSARYFGEMQQIYACHALTPLERDHLPQDVSISMIVPADPK